MRRYIFIFTSLFFLNIFSDEEVEKKIKGLLPDDLTINFIDQAELDGFFVVNVDNNQILFISKDFEYFFVGDLLKKRLDQGYDSLNIKYRSLFAQNLIKKINKKEFIQFKSPKEITEITVFTDVSCAYCRLMHSQIDNYLDLGITVNYLAFPQDGLVGKVFEDMQKLWCSDNRNVAITELKKGNDIEANACTNPVEGHFKTGRLIGATGTPTIVLSDGRIVPGYIPAEELIEIIING